MSSPILLIVVVADLNSRFDFVGCKASQDRGEPRGRGTYDTLEDREPYAQELQDAEA